MNRFLDQNTVELLKTICSTYAATETYECELNIYDMASSQISDRLFKSFSFGKPLKEEFSTWVKTLYKDVIDRDIVREQDVNSDKEHVVNKIRINSFAVAEKQKSKYISEYGSVFKVKFSDELPVENVEFDECTPVAKEIKQRLSLIYDKWRIDKTLRFMIDPSLERIDVSRFDRDNFDNIRLHSRKDLEIEYIGPRAELFSELEKLIQLMYKDVISNTSNTLPFDVKVDNPSQPVTLTQSILQELNMKDFVWLYKFDGDRALLVIGGNKAYKYEDKQYTPLADLNKEYKPTVLDCEFLDGVYHIFDAMCVDGNYVNTKFFKDRMRAAAEFASTFNESIKLRIKEYFQCKSIADVIAAVNTTRVIDKTLVDGAILQKITTPYYIPMIRSKLSQYSQFKVKARYLNTVDFQLMWSKSEERYVLFTNSNCAEANSHVKTIVNNSPYYSQFFPRLNPMNCQPQLKLLAVAASPYYENMSYMKPNLDYDKSSMFEHDIKHANELIKQMRDDPMKFSRRICECAYTGKEWIPLKMRDDKPFPNSSFVFDINTQVIFNYFHEVDSYFNHDVKASPVIDAFKNANRIMRTYIFEKYINPIAASTTNMHLIDLACGRGADIPRIKANAIYKTTAIDADADALVEYYQRFRKIMYSNDYTKPLRVLPHIDMVPNRKNYVLNILHYNINKDTITAIINDLYGRAEWAPANVIIMNFAIHYMLFDPADLVALRDMIEKVLVNGGIFIFTYFSGDDIMHNAATFNKFKTFNITVKGGRPRPKPAAETCLYKAPRTCGIPGVRMTGGSKTELKEAMDMAGKIFNHVWCINHNAKVLMDDVNKVLEQKDMQPIQMNKKQAIQIMAAVSYHNGDASMACELIHDIVGVSTSIYGKRNYAQLSFMKICPETFDPALVQFHLDKHIGLIDQEETLVIRRDILIQLASMYHAPFSSPYELMTDDSISTQVFRWRLYCIAKHYSVYGELYRMVDNKIFNGLGDIYSDRELAIQYINPFIFANMAITSKVRYVSVFPEIDKWFGAMDEKDVTNDMYKLIINTELFEEKPVNVSNAIIISTEKLSVRNVNFTTPINALRLINIYPTISDTKQPGYIYITISEFINYAQIFKLLEHYSVKHMYIGGDTTIASMPLLSIDASGQRDEPLVTEDVLDEVFSNFVVVGNEYPALDTNVAKMIKDIKSAVTSEELEELTQYIKLLKVRVLKLSK